MSDTSTTSTSSEETLVNTWKKTGMNINIRSINSMLTQLFLRYSIALNKITGNEVFKKTQTRQLRDSEGIAVPYAKGNMVVKNDIDKLRFLLDNRSKIAEQLGVQSQDIFEGKKSIGEISDFLSKLENTYDLGNLDDNMQLYVSKYDNNIGSLESQKDWVDYILTQTWVDKLGAATVDQSSNNSDKDSLLVDTRIEHLADMMQGMMKDHEIDYHRELGDFDPNDFLDSGKNSLYVDALNKLKSFDKLEHVFYQMHKPLGGSTDRFLDIKVYTTGEMDISGVVSLADCRHVEWKYGSMEYLRSLNTGNQKYEFAISLPFNDLNSVLWWKPDNPEPMEAQEDPGAVNYRYYKAYENERFLRWFGTTSVPLLDPDTLTVKTMCAVPKLSNDITSSGFFENAANLIQSNNFNIGRSVTSSISMLSLQQKSTIDLVTRDGKQYLSFIVTGNQQTEALSFHVVGKILPIVPPDEINHYAHTYGFIKDTHSQLTKEIMFLELTESMNPVLAEVWNTLFPDKEYIPQEWRDIQSQLKRMLTPNMMELTRFRQIDMDVLTIVVNKQANERREFLKKVSDETWLEEICQDQALVTKIGHKTQKHNFHNQILFDYIQGYGTKDNDTLAKWLLDINLSDDKKQQMVNVLEELVTENPKYKMTFDITVDELRKRIQTLNTLIVRLPRDTYINRVTSRHIFLDWKTFVDQSLINLVTQEKLYVDVDEQADGTSKLRMHTGVGTDGIKHEYI